MKKLHSFIKKNEKFYGLRYKTILACMQAKINHKLNEQILLRASFHILYLSTFSDHGSHLE
jgi:hypothetical protein